MVQDLYLKISEPILKDSSRNYEEIWWITAFNKTFGEQDENLTQDEQAHNAYKSRLMTL